VGSDGSSLAAIPNLYNSLVRITPEGVVGPELAESWNVTNGGLTYTFKLREGVMSHSGNEITAEDVVFSMDRMLTMGEGLAYLFLPYIDETTAVDTYTVQFDLLKNFGPILTVMPNFCVLDEETVMEHLGEGEYGDLGDYGKEWLMTHDAGSGPYMVKEFLLEEKLVMEKFDDFWGETLDVEGFKFVENAPDIMEMIGTTEPITVRTMMARQELERTDSWQPIENLEEMVKTEGVEMIGEVGSALLNLMMHTRKAPTDDIHFRKAIAYAFDYETVVTDIFPHTTMVKGVVNEVLPGYDPSLEPYRMNLDKAMEELQQSAYYDQLDEIEIEIHWCAEVPAEERVSLLFMANMAELGISVKIVKEPWLSMIETMADQELSPNVVVVYNSVHFPEVGGDVMRYHSESAPTWEQNEWLLDETLDAMIEDALETVDQMERFEKYSDIQQYIYDLCPTVYVLQTTTLRGIQDYVDYPYVEYGEQVSGFVYSVPLGFRTFYGLYTGINAP
jgi:peptide/nickel transport system substrate-binding protein